MRIEMKSYGASWKNGCKGNIKKSKSNRLIGCGREFQEILDMFNISHFARYFQSVKELEVFRGMTTDQIQLVLPYRRKRVTLMIATEIVRRLDANPKQIKQEEYEETENSTPRIALTKIDTKPELEEKNWKQEKQTTKSRLKKRKRKSLGNAREIDDYCNKALKDKESISTDKKSLLSKVAYNTHPLRGSKLPSTTQCSSSIPSSAPLNDSPEQLAFMRNLISTLYLHPNLLGHEDFVGLRNFMQNLGIEVGCDYAGICIPTEPSTSTSMTDIYPELPPNSVPFIFSFAFISQMDFDQVKKCVTIQKFSLMPSMKLVLDGLVQRLCNVPKFLFLPTYCFVYQFLIRFGADPNTVYHYAEAKSSEVIRDRNWLEPSKLTAVSSEPVRLIQRKYKRKKMNFSGRKRV